MVLAKIFFTVQCQKTDFYIILALQFDNPNYQEEKKK